MTYVTKEKIIDIIIRHANTMEETPYETPTSESKYYRIFCTIVDQATLEACIMAEYPEFDGLFMHEVMCSDASISMVAEAIANRINENGPINYGSLLFVQQVKEGINIKELSEILSIKPRRIKDIQKCKCVPTKTEKILIKLYIKDPGIFDFKLVNSNYLFCNSEEYQKVFDHNQVF